MVDLINSRSIRYNQGSNFDNAPLIANTRADVQAYNVHQLISLNKPIARIPPKDLPSLSLNNAAVETGLHDNLNLAIGCRVMLTTNLCVQAGLVNGALGTVNDIVYSQESNYPQDQPMFVLVKFDAVAGVFGSKGGLPIIPIQRHFIGLESK